MNLAGRGGDRVRIDVAGYRFPDAAGGTDANWLTIALEASVGGRSWQVLDPSLTTDEVAGLAAWLDALAAGEDVSREIGFIEPSLSFRVAGRRGNDVVLHAGFALECRPPWARESTCPGNAAVRAELAVPPEALREAAASLRAALERFPAR